MFVYAVDRLGRDAIDVQATVRHGLGTIAKDVGELILAVLAQVAAMERQRSTEGTKAGRNTARATLAALGETRRGKTSLGRRFEHEPSEVAAWRMASQASIAATAAHWDPSPATVKRYCQWGCCSPVAPRQVISPRKRGWPVALRRSKCFALIDPLTLTDFDGHQLTFARAALRSVIWCPAGRRTANHR